MGGGLVDYSIGPGRKEVVYYVLRTLIIISGQRRGAKMSNYDGFFVLAHVLSL